MTLEEQIQQLREHVQWLERQIDATRPVVDAACLLVETNKARCELAKSWQAKRLEDAVEAMNKRAREG
jgi:outer membrane murein-binding lipoprotein Lpp